METRHLIEPSALVVRIDTIKAGDIYKRLDKPSYGSERMVFGHVTSVLNNGEESVLMAVEFAAADYTGAIEPTVKTFSGGVDLMLFPATVEEYEVAMSEALTKQRKAVEAAERDLFTKESVLNRMQDAYNMRITVPATTDRPRAIEPPDDDDNPAQQVETVAMDSTWAPDPEPKYEAPLRPVRDIPQA